MAPQSRAPALPPKAGLQEREAAAGGGGSAAGLTQGNLNGVNPKGKRLHPHQAGQCIWSHFPSNEGLCLTSPATR